VSEDNFLNEPLPTPILCIENTNLNNHTTELIEQHVETSPDYEIDKGNLVPDLGGSQTREEIPQSNQELRVYARKFPQRNKKQSIISASSKPETPDDGPTEIPQEQTNNSKNSTDNVDLPIALRKKSEPAQKGHSKLVQAILFPIISPTKTSPKLTEPSPLKLLICLCLETLRKHWIIQTGS
jgi:hypothetical protein